MAGIIWMLPVTVHPQKASVPLSVEDALKAKLLRSNAPIDLSPDGRWVAYTTQDRSKSRPNTDEQDALFLPNGTPASAIGCEVRITNTESDETKNLAESEKSSWGPVWSPNGEYLAFYSDRSGQAHLWIWEKLTGKLRQLSDVIVRPFNPFEVPRWTPDSKQIMVKVLPENLTIQEANNLISGTSGKSQRQIGSSESTVTVYSSTATASGEVSSQATLNLTASGQLDVDNVFLSDLALIEANSGAVRRIGRSAKVRWYSASPDGVNLAYTVYKGFKGANTRQGQHDLVLVSLADLHSRIVATNIQLSEWGNAISWSPDGTLLSYTEGGPQANGECFVIPVNGGAPRKVTEALHPKFDGGYRPPLWDAAGRSLYFLASNSLWRVSFATGAASEVSKIPNRQLVDVISPAGGGRFWSPDGDRSMYVTTRDSDTKQVGFYKIDLITGRFTKLVEENKTYGTYLIFNVDVSGDKLIYRAEDAKHGPDLWMASSDFRNQKRLTQLNPQFDQYALGGTRLLEWDSADGQTLRGALLLPSNYENGRRYPLVVWVYGGALGSDSLNQFGLDNIVYNMQLLATRGYAVFYPDAPVRIGTPMQDLAKTVLPGIDKVLELGIADPERMAVMGWSYGGYSALALIVQTVRFRAAAIGAGLGNLFSMYGQMSPQGASWAIAWAEEGQGRMGGSPWEFPERYIENSPIFYLDRVQTPLLIVHGTLDRGMSSSLSDEIFVGLRRLGKEVTYAKYKGEGHGFLAFANQVDFCNRIIAWFDEHLKKTAKVSLASQTGHNAKLTR